MRTLGLDIGDRRIGLAVGDDDSSLAVPAGVVYRTRLKQDVARILEIAAERGAECIVAGLPLSVNGSEGPQARKVRAFLRRLEASTSLQVVTVDERYSTAEAERLLRQRDVKPSRRREQVDAVAAAVILQEYLDRSRSAGLNSLGRSHSAL